MPPTGILLTMERIARHLGANQAPAAVVKGTITRRYMHGYSTAFFKWVETDGVHYTESDIELTVGASGQYEMDLSGRRFVHDPRKGESSFSPHHHIWTIRHLFTKDGVVYLVLSALALSTMDSIWWLSKYSYTASDDVSDIDKWEHLGHFAKTRVSEVI